MRMFPWPNPSSTSVLPWSSLCRRRKDRRVGLPAPCWIWREIGGWTSLPRLRAGTGSTCGARRLPVRDVNSDLSCRRDGRKPSFPAWGAVADTACRWLEAMPFYRFMVQIYSACGCSEPHPNAAKPTFDGHTQSEGALFWAPSLTR